MGIYTSTIIVHGFYIRDKTIINLDQINNEWKIIDQKGVLIFVPETRYNVNSIDTILERKEIDQGYVSMNEVTKAFKLSASYFDPSTEQKDILNELYSLSNQSDQPNKNCGEIKTWLVEYSWSTLMHEHVNDLYFVRILPINY